MTIWVPHQGIKAEVTAVESVESLLKYSEQIDNSAWTKTRCSVDPTPVVAPDGTTTAEKIIASGVADPFVWQGAIQDPIGKTYTFSVWLWTDAGQPTGCELYMYGGTGAVLTDVGFKSITLTTTPQRFTFTQTFASSATTTVGRFDLPQLAAAGEYVYAWGAQLEKSSTAGGYVKTTAAARTATVLTLSKSVSVDTTEEFTNFCRYLEEDGTLSDQTEFTWAGTNQIAITDVLAHTPEYVFIGWGDDDIEFWNTWEIQ